MKSALLPRGNSLNLLRLGLALLVVVSHVWYVPGYGEVRLGGYDVGRLAVVGFFAISGFLVTRSATRTSWPRFTWHRVLRIYPGLLGALLLTAFVLAPLSLLLTTGGADGFAWRSAVSYVLRNLALVSAQNGIDGTIDVRSYQGVWNGPLWTLKYEMICYVGVALASVVGALRWRFLVPLLTPVFIALVALRALPGQGRTFLDVSIHQLALFMIPFLCGMSLALLGGLVPRSRVLGAASAVLVLAACFGRGESVLLVSVPFAYLLLWTASVVPMPSWMRGRDVSYGVYILGFPVQQIFMTAGLGLSSPWILLAATVPTTLLLAYASWVLVERPALSCKNWAGPRWAARQRRSDHRDPDPSPVVEQAPVARSRR